MLKVKVKVNVESSLYKPGVSQRVGRGIALIFLDRSSRSLWVVSSTLRPHISPGMIRYPLLSRLGGPQGRSGQVQNISSPPEFDPRIVQAGSSVAIPTELPDHLSPSNFLLFLPLLSKQFMSLPTSTPVITTTGNNNNNNNKLGFGCQPVAVVILHVYKTWNWLLINLSREGYMRST